MLRTRDESRFDFTHHASVQDFLDRTPLAGANSISVGTQKLDMLIEDRLSTTTLVTFHSALTTNETSVPVLQGRGIAASANMNLIALADPSIALGDIDLAWFLGNRGVGKLRPLLSPLVRHVLDYFESTRTILFGASGGGFAAANFGHDFPGCVVVAVNPRLDLTARPPANIGHYLNVCHGATSRTPQQRIRADFVTERLSDLVSPDLNHTLLIYQNTGDVVYLNHQVLPFLERTKGNPNILGRLEYYADGHKPIPTAIIREIMSQLSRDIDLDSAIQASGFTCHDEPAVYA